MSGRAGTPFEARRVAPSRGFGWLGESLALLKAQTARLLLIALLLQLILGFTQLPIVGLLVILAVPALNAGVLQCFHVTAAGGRPDIRLLLAPLTTAGYSVRLFALGAVVFAIGVVCISLLLSGSEELTDPALMQKIEQGDVEALAALSQESLGRIVLAFGVGVSVSGTVSFFTVPLIWFRDARLGQALVLGFKAMAVNWRPFLVAGVGLALLVVPVAVVSGLLLGLVVQGGPLALLVLGLVMVVLLLFQMVLFAVQYCAFRDIFGLVEQAAPPSPGQDDQFVA